jgi:hypothetical protein
MAHRLQMRSKNLQIYYFLWHTTNVADKSDSLLPHEWATALQYARTHDLLWAGVPARTKWALQRLRTSVQRSRKRCVRSTSTLSKRQ